MPLDVAALLEETGALQSGHFRLSSGLHSPSYVQCALLLERPGHAKAIGEALAESIAPLGPKRIAAPALGGLIIGYTVAQARGLPLLFTERKEGVMALRRGFQVGASDSFVVVEDVVTTGKSSREAADVLERHEGVVEGFASILNRSGRPNPFGLPYESLLTLEFPTWTEAECPLCRDGVPIDSPGSRFTR
jgi:orotate phosphoribosyltransferase